MLYTQTVEAGTLDLIKKLMADNTLNSFFLVGGTALSLMIGHRISIDIDLFTDSDFDAALVKKHLQETYNLTRDKCIANGVFCFIDNIKIDLISHQYSLLQPLQVIDGIRMTSIEDIAAMKLHAIVNSGNRLKDFVDLYYLLEHLPFETIAKGYTLKYPGTTYEIARAAVAYFDDIDHSVPVKLTNDTLNWKNMQQRIKQATVFPSQRFRPSHSHNNRKGLNQ